MYLLFNLKYEENTKFMSTFSVLCHCTCQEEQVKAKCILVNQNKLLHLGTTPTNKQQ